MRPAAPQAVQYRDDPVLDLAADQPHASPGAGGDVPLGDGNQSQSVQAEQDTAIERARLGYRPRGFLHLFIHTTNKTARPLHAKIGRADIRRD